MFDLHFFLSFAIEIIAALYTTVMFTKYIIIYSNEVETIALSFLTIIIIYTLR